MATSSVLEPRTSEAKHPVLDRRRAGVLSIREDVVPLDPAGDEDEQQGSEAS
jgi:hypothetical protein